MSTLSDSMGTVAEDYGTRYYAHYTDSEEPYSWESPGWRAWFTMVASRIVEIQPVHTVLDVGCAKGLLVQGFVEAGCDARGIDLSSVAIEQASPEVRVRLDVASATAAIDRRYDLITCIEVLEHMGPADAEAAIDNMCRATTRVVLSSTPGNFDEATHINVHPVADWAAAFATRGFFRRADVDLAFLTPWAIYFEKAPLDAPDLVRLYEDLLCPMRSERADQRAGLLEAHRRLASTMEDESQETVELRRRLEVSKGYIRGAEAELGDVCSERDEAQHEARALHGQLAEVQENLNREMADLRAAKTSTRWRLGGALVGPLALVTGRRRR